LFDPRYRAVLQRNIGGRLHEKRKDKRVKRKGKRKKEKKKTREKKFRNWGMREENLSSALLWNGKNIFV
jgi:hypothetical protein